MTPESRSFSCLVLERGATWEQLDQLRIEGELAIDGIQVGWLGDRSHHDDLIERVLMAHRKIGDGGRRICPGGARGRSGRQGGRERPWLVCLPFVLAAYHQTRCTSSE
jgi:hypothetical protein